MSSVVICVNSNKTLCSHIIRCMLDHQIKIHHKEDKLCFTELEERTQHHTLQYTTRMERNDTCPINYVTFKSYNHIW